MANFGDFRGSYDKMIALLKSIDRNTSNCCALSPSVGTDVAIPADSKYVKITKTSVGGTVTITFPDATVHTLSTNGEIFEIPYTGIKYPAITVASGDGGTWTWLILS